MRYGRACEANPARRWDEPFSGTVVSGERMGRRGGESRTVVYAYGFLLICHDGELFRVPDARLVRGYLIDIEV